ncbi:MAG TPA: hypothetical protein VF203_00280 [Burkholderiales bacterium]
MNGSICIGLLIALSTVSAAGFADTAIMGSGPTRSAAADQANERARYESQRRFKRDGCYTSARSESCKKTGDGGYVCTAYVADHAGSCH